MHLENYGIYAEFVETQKITIYTKDITNETYESHFTSILNIMRDFIETDFIRTSFITIVFDNGAAIDLTTVDFFFNLLLWYLVIVIPGNRIQPIHLVFENAITPRTLKNYVDLYFIKPNLKKLDIIILNNVIDDCLYRFKHIDEFSMYLANTINLEDFITLKKQIPEFDMLLHMNLDNIPMDQVKTEGMNGVKRAIELIKNSDHCLKPFFLANQGINVKQFREFGFNIGTKPDGRGGVFPTIINKSFINGGVNDIISFAIESSTGRTSQIIVNNNVGKAGYLARKLGLNNTDTFLHEDPNYSCDTLNYQEYFIKDEHMLRGIVGRYYRFNPIGLEFVVDDNSTNLIGKTICLRSPITCASKSRGDGICYKCYGDLSYINRDINIGKIAAELLSAILTQMMLSAKHLLEAEVRKLNWVSQFEEYFEVEYNMIKLREDIILQGYKLTINPLDIALENEDDEEGTLEFNEFIHSFNIESPAGEVIEINTTDFDSIFFTIDLNNIIRENAIKHKDKISLDLDKLQKEEINLFSIRLLNNDLSKLLETVKSLIDTVVVIKKFNRHQLLQTLSETLLEGGMGLDAVHLELILSNQIRAVDNILETPEWQYMNEQYNILSLTQALNNHPSITVSLSFERIGAQLYNPLTYRKNAPSFMDLFFMEKPQDYISKTELVVEDKDMYDARGLRKPFKKMDTSKK